MATDKEMVEKQWQHFSSLRKNLIFRDFGSAIIVRLLERAANLNNTSLLDLMKFQVKFKSNKQELFTLTVGNYSRPDYTQELLRDRDRVLKREYDPSHHEED